MAALNVVSAVPDTFSTRTQLPFTSTSSLVVMSTCWEDVPSPPPVSSLAATDTLLSRSDPGLSDIPLLDLLPEMNSLLVDVLVALRCGSYMSISNVGWAATTDLEHFASTVHPRCDQTFHRGISDLFCGPTQVSYRHKSHVRRRTRERFLIQVDMARKWKGKDKIS